MRRKKRVFLRIFISEYWNRDFALTGDGLKNSGMGDEEVASGEWPVASSGYGCAILLALEV
jgi:hypothetical protein